MSGGNVVVMHCVDLVKGNKVRLYLWVLLASGVAVGWGTVPQGGRSRVRFQVGSTRAVTSEDRGISLGVMCGGAARRADNSVVLVVPNVKVKMEAQHSVPPPLILRDNFTF